MAGISKAQKKINEERKVRAEKATRSMTEGLAKIIAEHIPEMLKNPNGATFRIDGAITKEGGVDAVLSYHTTVTARTSFVLDDGQEEMFPAPSETNEPPTQPPVVNG